MNFRTCKTLCEILPWFFTSSLKENFPLNVTKHGYPISINPNIRQVARIISRCFFFQIIIAFCLIISRVSVYLLVVCIGTTAHCLRKHTNLYNILQVFIYNEWLFRYVSVCSHKVFVDPVMFLTDPQIKCEHPANSYSHLISHALGLSWIFWVLPGNVIWVVCIWYIKWIFF